MLRFLQTCKLMRTLLNMILFVPIGNNYIIKFFSGNCDYKLQYHRYSVSVMPILSMKLFDHFGNHIWDLDKVPYITCVFYILIKLEKIFHYSKTIVLPAMWLHISNYFCSEPYQCNSVIFRKSSSKILLLLSIFMKFNSFKRENQLT